MFSKLSNSYYLDKDLFGSHEEQIDENLNEMCTLRNLWQYRCQTALKWVQNPATHYAPSRVLWFLLVRLHDPIIYGSKLGL